MTNFWFIFLPGDFPGMTSLRRVLGCDFSAASKSHSRQPALNSTQLIRKMRQTIKFRWWLLWLKRLKSFWHSQTAACEELAKIFFCQHSKSHDIPSFVFEKFLSTSFRVSLDDLIISRKAATPPWLRILESFKKNCSWQWQGMRDTLDLSSYHRELSSRIASEYQLSLFTPSHLGERKSHLFRSSSLYFSLNRCCNHVAVTIKLFFCLLILSSFTLSPGRRLLELARTFFSPVAMSISPLDCRSFVMLEQRGKKYDKLNWGGYLELNWGRFAEHWPGMTTSPFVVFAD